MKSTAKTKKNAAKKISRLAKAWRAYAKNRDSREKLIDFYEAFLNAQFWMKLHHTEEKNYAKYKKRGILVSESFRVSVNNENEIPLFEDKKDLQKMVNISIGKERDPGEAIQQHGGEIIYQFSNRSKYSIKIKGVRDFVHVGSDNVGFMKKNFKKK
ncbi:MAG TPA: hypothetical protein VF817_04295 [Patescibacteria group bacterium]